MPDTRFSDTFSAENMAEPTLCTGMPEIIARAGDLRRPQLLIRAARHGLEGYDRGRDLARLLRGVSLPRPGRGLARLLDEEDRHETMRRSGSAAWSAASHVDILIAVMAELRIAQAFAAAGAPPQPRT